MQAHGVVERLTLEQEAARIAKLKVQEQERRSYLRKQAETRIREAQEEIKALDAMDRPAASSNFTLVSTAVAAPKLSVMARLQRYAQQLRARFNRATTFHFLKASGVAAAFVLGGVFNATNVGADGQVKWSENLVLNGITAQGMNHMLDVTVHAVAQKTVWYLGLINNSPTPTLAVGDTYASHAGWTELTAFSQTLRVTWGVGSASSGSSTNATTSDFSMNATNTVYGLALFSVSTKGDTATSGGVLFATAAFSGGNQGVSNGDTLKVTYTLTGTPT